MVYKYEFLKMRYYAGFSQIGSHILKQLVRARTVIELQPSGQWTQFSPCYNYVANYNELEQLHMQVLSNCHLHCNS